jgi:soluble lytic murein transglycosylase-like protein
MAQCKIDLSSVVMQEAQRQGVDPAIALAVARTESGVCHWSRDGLVITSSAGAIGIMQLMPATAAELGVDAMDLYQNIRGGVTYLKTLYEKYGSWNSALAAYNWGPGKLDGALKAGASIPGDVLNYVKKILGIGTVYNAGIQQQSNSGSSSSVGPQQLLSNVVGILAPRGRVPVAAIAVVGSVAIIGYLWFKD